MVCIRPAKTTDLLEMQHCNLYNLPENYNLRYWMYHITSWTQIPQVAIDERTGKVVGYVLGKMEDEESDKNSIAHGHITSISVLREYRKLGIATKLMRAAQFAMETVYQAKYCSLHVRVSNEAAIALYGGVLGYEKNSVAEKYYADGDVHQYFSPYETPYEAYINFMNVARDLEYRIQREESKLMIPRFGKTTWRENPL